MTEAEWIDCIDVLQQNQFLLKKGRNRKLQLFLCACCRRINDLISDEQRHRVTRMAGWHRTEHSPFIGDVWQVFRQAVEVAERFADGLANSEERREATESSQAMSDHFGDIAASAPSPGENPDYDEAAVSIGCDVAAAADCAASVLPSAAELAVRVAASGSAFDREAYFAGAHGYPGVDRNNPHLVARRRERLAQWRLLVDVFGNSSLSATLNPSSLTPTVVQLAQTIYDDRAFDGLPVLADALQETGCDNDEILGHCRGPGPHVRGCWVVDVVIGKGATA